MQPTFDLAVVGSGIVGLAHATMAARQGKRVIVIDRDAQANGASVRSYGLVQVTGQPRATSWSRARRSRELWLEVAREAGIPIDQRGLLTVALRPEGQRLLEAFEATEMGEGCELLTAEGAPRRVPALRRDRLLGALWSPGELRIEARAAIPRLAKWLSEAHGVEILRSTHVRSVMPPRLDTTSGVVRAEAAVICPGDDVLSLFPARLAHYKVTRSTLQMLRLTPNARVRLGAAVQSDLGLLHSPGFASLPEARALRTRLEHEQRESVQCGVRLQVVQSADRTLVVGDARQIGPTPSPFAPAGVERLILEELDRVLDLPARTVAERWSGVVPVTDRPMIIDRPSASTRIVAMTGGMGLTAAFAVAEEVVADLLGAPAVATRDL